MKKILTMAAVALLAASCSNDKDVITPDLGTAERSCSDQIDTKRGRFSRLKPRSRMDRRWKVSW